ncbi:[citrate (pro-3S)-lyase] ligase [Clostridium sp. MCC353]|uniref:[citrate (pro-3S)-lyase] ligase n=1 Tax=Clostridium sp. MCC353 TaxID=2592646 RepID=UPI001C039C32|nr:[citrate (pro-3S)-lyase] ligase [Clostridium sp. MCC353]MBT9779294.1 [citrate (pro-3S)-lyase] ligase [Clostridium sp. MCC353]
MSEYTISRIDYKNKREMKQLDALLEKEGIERDKNLEYTAGLFDEDYQLAATGSCFFNTLRCLAVDSSHQGEGLLNQIISHLIEFQYGRGITNLFLYTKCATAKFFKDLGFYEIARVDGKVVFMENRRDGFSGYLNRLVMESQEPGPVTGAVVMNANPFTLGHQYLVETAAAACDVLHVFVVSEDVSLIPFSVRFQLVKEGTAHLSNVICHETGSYMISNATFPSYFLKDSDTVIRSHAKLDIEIFVKIARSLGITKRFVGEEPFSQVTGIYNEVMKEELEQNGLECRIIPRKENSGGAISASRVRLMIKENRLEELKQSVPETTYRYFISSQAEPVIKRIQSADEVVHY